MAAKYQHASDFVRGMPPYSGVIRDDGRWCPNQGANPDWQEYLKWAAEGKNHAGPFLSPEDGGVVIKLQKDEVAVGSMLDSMPPPEPEPLPVVAAPEPKPEPSPPSHATASSGRRSTSSATSSSQ